MFDTATIITALALVVVLAPTGLLAALGLTSLVGRPLAEARTARAVRWSVTVALLAAVGVFMLLAHLPMHPVLDRVCAAGWAAVLIHLVAALPTGRLGSPAVRANRTNRALRGL